MKGQGKKGQMVEVSEGYARNFLLPRKLAIAATTDAINTMNLKEKARRAEEAANRQAAVEMGGKLKNVTVKLTAKGGKEGKLGVEGMKPEILLDALRRAGATIEGEDAPLPGARITKADLYAAGCRNVQFDDCTWTRLCDASVRERLGWSDEDALRLQQENLDVINAVIADQPDDLVINTHVCRGNFHSTWLSSGGYAPVAAKLFGEENVDAYYLEFDDDRSGDFAPLAEVSGDKKVVLGLITSKKPDLEDPDTIKARIQEATQYIPLDRLCLSTQCGFASTQEGNKLTEDQQWAKIALVQSIAKDVWGE